MQGGGPGFAGHALLRGALGGVWLGFREHREHGCAVEFPIDYCARKRIDYLASVGGNHAVDRERALLAVVPLDDRCARAAEEWLFARERQCCIEAVDAGCERRV